MDYPWYDKVSGGNIQQGDIIENCPVFIFPSETSIEVSKSTGEPLEALVEYRDTIVMSQTCDVVNKTISEVLLCIVWKKSDFSSTDRMAKKENWEHARKGRMPGFQVLNKCDLEGFKQDFRIVDFRRVHSLPLELVCRIAGELGDRIRLLPPYREHLSQAFARFFMRVGLPVDIPPFT